MIVSGPTVVGLEQAMTVGGMTVVGDWNKP